MLTLPPVKGEISLAGVVPFAVGSGSSRTRVIVIIVVVVVVVVVEYIIILIILSLRASRRPGPRVHPSLLKGFYSSKFVSSG